MKRSLIFTVLLIASFAPYAPARAQTCVALGFGQGGSGSPVSGSRQIGSRQWWKPDSQGTPYAIFGAFTFYLTSAQTGVLGQSVRHVLEGAAHLDNLTPTSCNVPVAGGHTGPCPASPAPPANQIVVPDACPEAYGVSDYVDRLIANVDKYAPMSHNGTFGAFQMPAADVGTMKMTNLSADHVGMDSAQPNIANTAFGGELAAKMQLYVNTRSQGWRAFIFQNDHPKFTFTTQPPAGIPLPTSDMTLKGGHFYELSNCFAGPGDSGSPVYAHFSTASGGTCWQPVGAVVGSDIAAGLAMGTCYVESELYNVLPELNLAYGTQLQPAGNCTVAGPKTAAGNYDPTNFLWYTQSVIDQMYAAHAKYDQFEQSLCDANGANCGQTDWTDVISAVSLPALPSGSSIIGMFFTDNGIDPTAPLLGVDFICGAGPCTPPQGYHTVSDYVQHQVLTATNGVISVQTALQSFGLPSTMVQVVQKTQKPSGLDQPMPIPTPGMIQYYTGTLPNYVGGSGFETVLGLAFNLIPNQITGTLFTRVGNKDCAEMIAGSPYTLDIQYSGGRIIATFHSVLTITAIQWGVNQGNTINPPSYCGTTAHVGDVLTLDGIGTCATSDVHEFCNQQFQIIGNGSSGNLMRVHSQYLGGSQSPVANISFIDPGTQIPGVIDTYWDSTRRCLNGVCNQYPLLFSVYDPCCGGIYRIELM